MSSKLIAVRRSSVHGRGAFANVDLSKGRILFDYEGERITWKQACADHAARGTAGHTLYFALGDGTVIDGGSGGNAARWLNHSCRPNCEAFHDEARIRIRTLRRIPAGTELTIDYNLIVENQDDPEVRELYACACGARRCRGVMLAG